MRYPIRLITYVTEFLALYLIPAYMHILEFLPVLWLEIVDQNKVDIYDRFLKAMHKNKF